MPKPLIIAILCLAALLPASVGTRPLSAQSTNKIELVTPTGKSAKAPGKANAPEAKTASRPDAPLLPASFAGWEAGSAAKALTDPTQADPANPAALKEYGFADALLNDYTRNGDTLKLKAMRFVDATGAYGAYSFYRHSGWPREDIGTGAASDNNRVLFWKGNILVDAQFSHLSAMSASELRGLASTLPVPAGNKALAPPLLGNLPQKDMQAQSIHYALGPAGYLGPGGAKDPIGVLPPELVGFERGAETATVTYALRSGPATLTVINYPTPQMADAQEKAISAYLAAGNTAQHPLTKPLQDSNAAAIAARRSGPLVAVVSGDAITDESFKLLGLVHYEADTAAIPGGESPNPVQNLAKLIIGIIVLVVVMFLAAVVVAGFLGGGRAAFRVMRGKPASSLHDDDFTRLDLK